MAPAEFERDITDPTAYAASFDITGLADLITPGEDVLMPVAAFALHLLVGLALAFYLLGGGHRIAGSFRQEVSEDSSL